MIQREDIVVVKPEILIAKVQAIGRGNRGKIDRR